ncbi:hypothetical protein PHMEG_00011313 [Phytophthora megakarya]|uniref:Uncharacterized protein n=1 Tax=Phytophthora megakarya TaxID=4795 RepID=A0A225WDK1_9STRA|nr:hypothetical protein PHMEG_00011313 [Phytophthora megakarya]
MVHLNDDSLTKTRQATTGLLKTQPIIITLETDGHSLPIAFAYNDDSSTVASSHRSDDPNEDKGLNMYSSSWTFLAKSEVDKKFKTYLPMYENL